MIAVDTSVWVDYFKGHATPAARDLDAALEDGAVVLPAPVLLELLSGSGVTKDLELLLLRLPRVEPDGEVWERAGRMRRAVIKKKLKARSMGCLIAQICIDEKIPLLTSDSDFRHFRPFGLKLAR